MKHAASRELYGYWQRVRRGRPAPDRSEIEPSDIRRILGDTFILEVAAPFEYRFRLAGTRVCAAFGREMKGKNFMDFWTGKDRETMATLFSAISEDAAAAVIGVEGHAAHGRDLAFELLCLPVRQKGEGYNRVIGTLAPMDDPYWIGLHPIVKQRITSLRLIWPDEKPSFLLRGADLADEIPETPMFQPAMSRGMADGHRRVGHLTVYEGGKEH